MKIGILLVLFGLLIAGCTADVGDDPGSNPGGEDPTEDQSWRYIARVLEYKPAPGQFMNEGSSGVLIDNPDPGYDEVLANVSKALVGKCNGLISLGGFGGYIVVGFDHPIKNIPGEYDFKVYGNAFWDQLLNLKDGGSCEPGVIMVSRDVNGNGKPDDEWYEIAGSAYGESDKDYEIIYYRTAEPGDVRWRDNRDKNGVIKYLPDFHTQNYYPSWVAADSMVFRGTRLPDTAVNRGEEVGMEEHWVLYALGWGYADNRPNNEDGCKIKIDWAVDKEGKAVNLPEISFIRIYTGQNQQCGWVGETSTEIGGIENLNPEK